jgi:dimeric dUTPase (all-alpha-NTP-PPase superfamily)
MENKRINFEAPLEGLFDLQAKLVDGYIAIEKLPTYPIHLDSRPGQALIRDFLGRLSEELSEAYEEYEKIHYILLNNQSKRDIPKLVHKANEEWADCMHFYLEVLLYSNIDAYTIEKYVERLAQEGIIFDSLISDEPLQSLLNYTRHENIKEGFYIRQSRVITLDDREWDADLLTYGYKSYYADSLEPMAILSWNCIHTLNKAQNCLKNKAWKQKDQKTNVAKYHESLMIAFIHFLRLTDFVGLDKLGILENYQYKNQINLKRQKDKY